MTKRNSTETLNQPREIERSAVTPADNPSALLNAFEGDKVKLPVEENGKYFAKRMEIVKAERKRGMWEYQVKGIGEASLHKDRNGNDWFRENDLEWW